MKSISEFYSDDGLKTAMVFVRGSEFRVTCLNSYDESQSDSYFIFLREALAFAEDWVSDYDGK